MKIARYSQQGQTAIGLVVGDKVHPIDGVSGMIALIGDFAAWRDRISSLAAAPGGLPLAEVTLLSPIERPGKIMAIGLNYADHAAEAAMELPTEQLWFAKAATAINGPFAPIDLPKVSTALDYEAELVIVIGKRCRHVSRADAASVIFGFCVGNDVTVRDWQFKTSQFILGKSFDTHAPVGPWIVTGDEIDPSNLEISSWVNGERRQHSNTKYFIFDCAAVIEHLSKVMTLEPGDLIFTGTPAGVGAVMKPPKWLVAGDVVKVEIAGIGAIENTVAPEPDRL
jgi:2-keto-4-pentenoate hydratase/2-oxohepta-3-ene-1,7-dioic acid hydratase in catechol pathway